MERCFTGVRLYIQDGPDSDELGARIVHILGSAVLLSIALLVLLVHIPLSVLERGPRT